jgi:hypothetical protein
MNPELNAQVARQLTAERLQEAERDRRSRVEWSQVKPDPYDTVTVRLARPEDAEAVLRLAQLDNRRVPLGPALVAEVANEVLAVRSLITGSALADPFRPTAHLVELLELRSTHLRDVAEDRRRRRLTRPLAWLRALTATSRC